MMVAEVVELAVNRVLALDPASEERLSAMAGKSVAVVLAGPDITLYLQAVDSRLKLTTQSAAVPDTTITGSPAALFGLAKPEMVPSGSAGSVEINGDAHVGRQIEALFKQLDPDWEEPFCTLFGDVIGYQLYRIVRGALKWTRGAAEKVADDTSLYLREESRALVHKLELDHFFDQVDQLRDDVARLEVRINRLVGAGE